MEKIWPQPSLKYAVLGIAFILVLLVAILSQRYAPHALFGGIVIVWIVVNLLDIKQVEHIFVLWTLYSFVFYVLGVGKTDELGLLLWNSLVHAGTIVLHYTARSFLEANPRYQKLIALALVVPIQCNNLFYTPPTSFLRVILFWVMIMLTDGKSWLVSTYPLFCKLEAMLPLLLWHGCMHALYRPRPQALPAPLLPIRQVTQKAPKTSLVSKPGFLTAAQRAHEIVTNKLNPQQDKTQ